MRLFLVSIKNYLFYSKIIEQVYNFIIEINCGIALTSQLFHIIRGLYTIYRHAQTHYTHNM